MDDPTVTVDEVKSTVFGEQTAFGSVIVIVGNGVTDT